MKSIVCGKGILLKKMEIKGRGRMGIRKVPKCSVKLVLEEKPIEEFYRMILEGKCPAGLADQLRTVQF